MKKKLNKNKTSLYLKNLYALEDDLIARNISLDQFEGKIKTQKQAFNMED